jgi:hypothetical protein
MTREASIRAAAPLAGALALVGLGAGPALAHHSFAMFDHVHRITVAGTVSKFDWTNPHVYIELTSADGKGGTTRYTIECASPNVLERVGWKFNTVKVGDKISALINPLKNGDPGGMLETLTTADGQTLSDSNPPGGTFER